MSVQLFYWIAAAFVIIVVGWRNLLASRKQLRAVGLLQAESIRQLERFRQAAEALEQARAALKVEAGE